MCLRVSAGGGLFRVSVVVNSVTYQLNGLIHRDMGKEGLNIHGTNYARRSRWFKDTKELFRGLEAVGGWGEGGDEVVEAFG